MRRALLVFVFAVVSFPRAAWPQGQPVGPEFLVNTYTTGVQGQPVAAMASSGDFVVVWTSLPDQDGSGYGIFGQRYDSSGASAGPEFPVNSYTTSQQFNPSVSAAAAAGDFVAVWMSGGQDGTSYGVFGQRYAGSGTPLGPEFRVNSYTTTGQSYPSVVADSAGNFVVVWQSSGQDGSGYGVFGQRYASSGAPLGPEFRVNSYTTGSQVYPAVGADSAGNFVVTWAGDLQDGSGYGVFGQRYASSGTPLGPEFRVNSYTTNFQGIPAVAADASGFVVAWTSYAQDGSTRGVFGQRYAASGAALGPEFRINTFTTGLQEIPVVAVDASGNFVVVWDSSGQDGSSAGVFGQRFDSSGNPLGLEFRANTATVNEQSASSVAANAAGNFVIVWNADIQDGSSFGVLGQRYAPMLPVELTRFTID